MKNIADLNDRLQALEEEVRRNSALIEVAISKDYDFIPLISASNRCRDEIEHIKAEIRRCSQEENISSTSIDNQTILSTSSVRRKSPEELVVKREQK